MVTLLELTTKDAIEVFIKYLTDRIALAILFASIISLPLMLIPGPLGTWMIAHWTWPFFGLLLSLCYLPTRAILDGVSERAARNKRHERLKRLTKKERELLEPYIRNDFRSRRIWYTDPVAKGLADDGVLSIPDVIDDNSGGRAYNIQDWARSYLKDHPEMFADIPKAQKTGDN